MKYKLIFSACLLACLTGCANDEPKVIHFGPGPHGDTSVGQPEAFNTKTQLDDGESIADLK